MKFSDGELHVIRNMFEANLLTVFPSLLEDPTMDWEYERNHITRGYMVKIENELKRRELMRESKMYGFEIQYNPQTSQYESTTNCCRCGKEFTTPIYIRCSNQAQVAHAQLEVYCEECKAWATRKMHVEAVMEVVDAYMYGYMPYREFFNTMTMALHVIYGDQLNLCSVSVNFRLNRIRFAIEGKEQVVTWDSKEAALNGEVFKITHSDPREYNPRRM